MKIVVVEDNAFQADLIVEGLRDAFADVDVRTLHTESQFWLALPELREEVPTICIIDIMLRWADPDPEIPPMPTEVEREGYHRAGLRCQALLQQDDKTRGVPVILFTVLEKIDLEGELPQIGAWVHLRKASSIGPLVEEVRRLTMSRGH